MKKTSMILISVVMLLAVVVGIVGMTAAWFGDIKNASNVIEISSEQPSGNATIVAGSESSSTGTDGTKLRPAILNPSVLLSDHDGKLSDIPVIGAEADKIAGENGTLKSVARQAEVSFRFQYSGAPQNGVLSEIEIKLTSVTLENPRTKDENDNVIINDSLTDYRDEFVLAMTSYTTDASALTLTKNSTAKGDTTVSLAYTADKRDITDENGNAVETDVYIPVQTNDTTSNTINAHIVSGSEHTIVVTVYFRHVDEETPPELMDVDLFFNFEINLVQKTA